MRKKSIYEIQFRHLDFIKLEQVTILQTFNYLRSSSYETQLKRFVQIKSIQYRKKEEKILHDGSTQSREDRGYQASFVYSKMPGQHGAGCGCAEAAKVDDSGTFYFFRNLRVQNFKTHFLTKKCPRSVNFATFSLFNIFRQKYQVRGYSHSSTKKESVPTIKMKTSPKTPQGNPFFHEKHQKVSKFDLSDAILKKILKNLDSKRHLQNVIFLVPKRHLQNLNIF